jgi:crossover junction endodeoxyribonuclease RuvC
VLGIDPSLTNFATVIFEEEDLIDEGVFKSVEKGTIRLIDIKEHLINIIQTYKPDSIGIEGYAYNRINQSHQLGELGGVIRTTLYQHGYVEGKNLFIIPPTNLKKFLTGKGNAKKELMLKEVFKRFGYDTNDNNLADAYTIVRYIKENE